MTKNNTRNYTLSILVLVVLALVMSLIAPFSNVYLKASAVSTTDYMESISVSNGDFSNTTGSASIQTPSSWTVVDSENASRVKAGVIDVSNSAFNSNSSNYGISVNPSAPATSTSENTKVLMINGEENLTSYGYSSSSLSLEANSFYAISFFANVQTSGANGASAYLVVNDVNDNLDMAFINFTTSNIWQKYSFYIYTGIKNISANVQLYLGGKSNGFNSSGAVFFDDVTMIRCAETTFKNIATANSNSKIIDLRPELDYQNQFENGSFEESISSSWTRIDTNNNANTFAGVTTLDASTFNTASTQISVAPGTNLRNAKIFNDYVGDETNNRGLFINNLSEASTGFKSRSVMFERFKCYIVSIWVKTGNLSSNGASIILTQKVDEGETAEFSSEFTSISTASNSNALTNDWVEYKFYVKGSPYDDIDLELQLWLGSKSSTTRGYVFFDEITVTEIEQNAYSDASEGAYIKKFNLSSINGSQAISNGAFNEVSSESEQSGIYTPSDWTFNSSNPLNKEKFSGIINTYSSHFASAQTGLSASQNPGAPLTSSDVPQNILMVRNIAPSVSYYESATFSLGANTTNEISVYVKSLSQNTSVILLDSSDNVLAKFENISENAWKQYKFYVKVGTNAKSLKLRLANGSELNQVSGYSFFDNATFKTYSDDIYAVGTTQYTRIIDFEQDNFENTDLYATNDIYTAYLWTASENNSTVQSGIIDARNQSLYAYDINPSDNNKSKVLFIYSPVDVHYSLTSKENYTLSSDSYYKVVVRLKTFGLFQDQINQQKDSNGNVIKYGAFVSLTNIDEGFSAISTQDILNQWVDYTFFVYTGTESPTTQVVISLGSENALTSGFICVESVAVSSITEVAYDEGVAELSSSYPPKNVVKAELSEKVESTDEEADTDDDSSNTSSGLGLIDIATIILGVAILIAIIGVLVRRVTKNKKERIKVQNEYDRSGIEITKALESKIEKLEYRVNQIDEQLANNETETSELKANIYELDAMKAEASKEKLAKINKEKAKINEKLQILADNKQAMEQEKQATLESINAEREKLIQQNKTK